MKKHDDYRIVCNNGFMLSSVYANKRDLVHTIYAAKRSNVEHYGEVKKRGTSYHTDFIAIYDKKCAYCGVEIGIVDETLFEVDHFICKSSFKDKRGKRAADNIGNLVLSCYWCNRGKGEFPLQGKYRKILNPDTNAIAKVFYRTDDYYIKIQDTYAGDKTVQEFYKKLHLGSKLKRLDYLLLKMKHLADANPKLRQELNARIWELLQWRNGNTVRLSKTGG